MADVFLSQAEIEQIVDKFSRTPAGKAAIQTAAGTKKPLKFVARFNAESIARVNAAERAEMIAKAEEMKHILYRHIVSDTKSEGRAGLANFPESAILVSQPKPVGNSGNYFINISFDGESLRRKSLDSDRFPDGIKDIIKLFTRGYSARGSVTGDWHGKPHVSLRHRAPNPFMSNAVQEFNSKYKDGTVAAMLSNNYS